MKNKLVVTLSLFGPFRQYLDDTNIKIEIPSDSRISDLRRIISKQFIGNQKFNSLLESSVFADESRILDDDLIIGNAKTLSLIPPVCGG